MKILDPGHLYELQMLDNDVIRESPVILQFVKREGEKFPGNVGTYPGTILQDVWRVCIDRLKYVDNQDHDIRNDRVLAHMRHSIFWLEERAAARHGMSEYHFNKLLPIVYAHTKAHIEDLEVTDNGHLKIWVEKL
jgi:hypothetical protein